MIWTCYWCDGCTCRWWLYGSGGDRWTSLRSRWWLWVCFPHYFGGLFEGSWLAQAPQRHGSPQSPQDQCCCWENVNLVNGAWKKISHHTDLFFVLHSVLIYTTLEILGLLSTWSLLMSGCWWPWRWCHCLWRWREHQLSCRPGILLEGQLRSWRSDIWSGKFLWS